MGSMLTYQLTTQVLFLMGAAGSLTGGHVDPVAAMTFAWLLQIENIPENQLAQLQLQPVATWLFISPAVFNDPGLLDKLLDALLEPEKLRASAWNLLTCYGSKLNLTLTSKQMHRVKGAMGEHAVLIEQKSGHGVWVPPGWLHCVYNNQACFKIAFEVCPASRAAACCYMQRRIRCSFKEAEVDVGIKGKGKVKVNASEDYICVRSLCLDALTRWHTWWQQD
ncbi:hypothetical protein COO60DRAFT_1491135 [Scenedesmus sp. NREL 46B-D3]|nr:hypothetical protein COO60DRAFT_1491135 [Scenedesmus sp. NREL 46B-D3]